MIEHNLALPDPCQARSWHYLKIHAEMMLQYLPLLAARAKMDSGEMARLWDNLKQYIQQAEEDLQPVFDAYSYIATSEQYFAREIN